MEQEELKMLENLLWKFRLQYADNLNKSELGSIIEILALLINKVKKEYGSNKIYSNLRKQ